MNRLASLLIVAALLTTARAESWPAIEQLASKAALIVRCRAAKAPDGAMQWAVVETWKGAYTPDAFTPEPPQGFIPAHDKTAPVSGEVILIYNSQDRAGGKFHRCDIAVPVEDGKVKYPGATAGPPGKEYTVAAFKAAIQSAVKFPLVNGDFDASPVGSVPDGWKQAYPTGGGIVASEGNDTFLRLTASQAQNAGMAQIVPVPDKATRISVLGRMRGKPRNEKDDKRAAVEVALRFNDPKGGMISAAVVTSGSSAAWRTFRREFTVPPGCQTVEVVARSIFAIGTFDFDAVRVEFK